MNSRCAFALPLTREAKSASERERVTIHSSHMVSLKPVQPTPLIFESEGYKRTISLSTGGGGTLADDALVLEIEVPALLLAGGVLEVERDDGLGVLDGVFALGFVGLEGGVDHVEGGGGGEGVCCFHQAFVSWTCCFWSVSWGVWE